MNQYEAIFYRRSVRKFQMKPLDSKIMVHINNYIQTVTPLHPEAAYRIAIIEACSSKTAPMKGLFRVEAPYYIVLSAKEHPYAAKNAGFIMEQIVLYLVSKGLGTCYQGNLVTASASELDGYHTMIVLAFGKGTQPASLNRGRRKRLVELADGKEEPGKAVKKILEAAMIAPSAVNLQPWRFTVYKNTIHVFMRKNSFALVPSMERLNEISMGIVLCHLGIAAEEQWMNWTLKNLEDEISIEMKGCEYVGTLILSEQLA